MDWLNLHIPTHIRHPAFIGSSPAERGTWLCVLAYGVEIECGGRLTGAANWKDRQWQQACGVTLREVRAADRLLRVDGHDVVINGYPSAKETEVQQKRLLGGGTSERKAVAARMNGSKGGRPKQKPTETHGDGNPITHRKPTDNPRKPIEGEVEGEREGEMAVGFSAGSQDTPDGDGLGDSLGKPTPSTGAELSNEERWERAEKRQPWAIKLGAVVSLTKWNWAPWKALCDDCGGVDAVLAAYRAHPDLSLSKLRKHLQVDSADALPPSDEAIKAVLEMGQEGVE